MVRIRAFEVGSRMGGPPIAFTTLTFLIGRLLRKLAFYAPLPHFENPCLLELPIAAARLFPCIIDLSTPSASLIALGTVAFPLAWVAAEVAIVLHYFHALAAAPAPP